MIAQVNEIVDGKRRCRASTSRPTGCTSSSRRRRPNFIEPLFTRDPRADHRDPGADGDDGDQGHLCRVRRAAAEPRHRLRHRRDRAAAADLWRVAGPEGQDRQALGAESASGADPGDRGRLGRVGAFLRLRARHGGLHPRALRRVLHRAGRQPAQQPRVLPGGRPLRLRHVHRLDAADRPGRQQLRPPRWAASPASAARRTWVPMRAAGAMPARPG